MKTRVNKGRFANLMQHKHYMAWLIYALSTLLILALQTAPRFFPIVFGARPMPLVGFVICVSVLAGARTGTTVGVLAGLLWGVYSSHLYGYDALVLMVFGMVVGLMSEWYLRANMYTALLLGAAGTLAYCILEWFFYYVIPGNDDVLTVLWRVFLPNAVYTIVLIPLVFWFSYLLARFVRQKLKN